MKYIKQFSLIAGFSLLGELLALLIPFPIPAAIYGFVLLFLALCTGLLKPAQIREAAEFLLSVMGLFFVAPAVNLLAYYGVIAPALVPVSVIVILSTFVVFGVSGLVTQWLCGKEGRSDG